MACGGDLPDAAIVLGAIAVVRGVALGYVPAALVVGELALAAAGILYRRVNQTGEASGRPNRLGEPRARCVEIYDSTAICGLCAAALAGRDARGAPEFAA